MEQRTEEGGSGAVEGSVPNVESRKVGRVPGHRDGRQSSESYTHSQGLWRCGGLLLGLEFIKQVKTSFVKSTHIARKS